MPDAISQDADATLVRWIERHVGKVTRIERQARWRPAWVVDAEQNGKLVPLYVKGPREVHALVPMRLEGRALQVLHDNGVPAPFQYGYCEELQAIVMERLPGESRLESIGDIAVRDRVVDQYVQAMVDFHRIDPAWFEAEGFTRPADPGELRLAQFSVIERMYLATKRQPEPCNEFLRRWIRRNIPAGDFQPAFITGDAFQMIYDQGALKAVMDLEMACIGDPLFDLACIRMRDLSEKTGEAARIARLYERLSGAPLDLDALRFHLAAFSAASSLLISDALSHPSPETDYFEYFVYYHGALRIALEAIAERLDIKLEMLPEPASSPTPQAIHLTMLAHSVEQIAAATDIERYQRSKALAEIAYLQRRDQFGSAFDTAYLDDIEALTGQRPSGPADAEIVLERFVDEAAPELDAALVRLLHRQALRQCFLADIPQNERLRRYLREPIAPLY